MSVHIDPDSPVPTAVDVLVIGGGPAGASAAFEIRQRTGCSVSLVNACDYQDFRAGESVPPTVRKLLSRLGDRTGLLDEQVALPSYGTDSAWGRNTIESHDYSTGLAGNGWHLDRGAFDANVAQIAGRSGVDVRTRMRAVNVQRTGRSWRVTLSTQAGRTTVEPRFIIDATGRRASIGRRLGARWSRFDDLVAIVARYDSLEKIPQRVTIEACPSGWWYAAPVPGDSIIVAWMSDVDLVRGDRMYQLSEWNAALRNSQHVGPLLASAKLTTPLRIRAAGSWFLQPAYGDGWLAVGDACACFDPLSSVGILEALRSGLACGAAIEEWLKTGDRTALKSHVATREVDFQRYLAERDRVYSQEQRFQQDPFWQRRRSALRNQPTKSSETLALSSDVTGSRGW